jgi:protein-disulfide isomerase
VLLGGTSTSRAPPGVPTAEASASTSSADAATDDDRVDHDIRWKIPLADTPRRGGRAPLVTIVEFADFECPFSDGVRATLVTLLESYGDDVTLVWKDLPLDVHTSAIGAARFARYARAEKGDAGGFWPAHDKLFSSCGKHGLTEIESIAGALGLDPKKARAAVSIPTRNATSSSRSTCE